jgi:type II secretory pathway component PulF
MGTSISNSLLFVMLIPLATWWAVWPESYVRWIRAVKEKLKLNPAMRASVDAVEAIDPLSSSKPWYPMMVRIAGIVIWLILLQFIVTRLTS